MFCLPTCQLVCLPVWSARVLDNIRCVAVVLRNFVLRAMFYLPTCQLVCLPVWSARVFDNIRCVCCGVEKLCSQSCVLLVCLSGLPTRLVCLPVWSAYLSGLPTCLVCLPVWSACVLMRCAAVVLRNFLRAVFCLSAYLSGLPTCLVCFPV